MLVGLAEPTGNVPPAQPRLVGPPQEEQAPAALGDEHPGAGLGVAPVVGAAGRAADRRRVRQAGPAGGAEGGGHEAGTLLLCKGRTTGVSFSTSRPQPVDK